MPNDPLFGQELMEIVDDRVKTCKTCLQSKPISEFSTDNNTKDKKRGVCRTCDSARQKKWRENSPDNRIRLRKIEQSLLVRLEEVRKRIAELPLI